jgi:hypothetical protein
MINLPTIVEHLLTDPQTHHDPTIALCYALTVLRGDTHQHSHAEDKLNADLQQWTDEYGPPTPEKVREWTKQLGIEADIPLKLHLRALLSDTSLKE